MPLVFSYGTLQLPEVQQATFGRVLDGWRDELIGFELSRVDIVDPTIVATGKTHHANVVRSDNESRVSGTVFEITDAEFAKADGYERKDSYVRIAARTISGREVWVYVDARSVRSPPPRLPTARGEGI